MRVAVVLILASNSSNVSLPSLVGHQGNRFLGTDIEVVGCIK